MEQSESLYLNLKSITIQHAESAMGKDRHVLCAWSGVCDHVCRQVLTPAQGLESDSAIGSAHQSSDGAIGQTHPQPRLWWQLQCSVERERDVRVDISTATNACTTESVWRVGDNYHTTTPPPPPPPFHPLHRSHPNCHRQTTQDNLLQCPLLKEPPCTAHRGLLFYLMSVHH